MRHFSKQLEFVLMYREKKMFCSKPGLDLLQTMTTLLSIRAPTMTNIDLVCCSKSSDLFNILHTKGSKNHLTELHNPHYMKITDYNILKCVIKKYCIYKYINCANFVFFKVIPLRYYPLVLALFLILVTRGQIR